MKSKLLFGMTAVMLSFNSLAAETSQYEFGAQFSSHKADNNGTDQTLGAAATYYLRPLELDQSQPFNDRDFLQRVGNVSIGAANSRFETFYYEKTTVTSARVTGKFFMGDFIFELGDTQWKKNLVPKNGGGKHYPTSNDELNLTAGYFFLPTTAINYYYRKTKTDFSPDPTGTLPPPTDYTETVQGAYIYTVQAIGGDRHWAGGPFYYQIKESQFENKANHDYGLLLKYYPNSNLFVQGKYRKNTGESAGSRGNELSASIGYSVTPRLGVYLSRVEFMGAVKSENSSSHTSTVSLNYRF